MTSLEVIDTDAFLDMPMSSQLLYFHLNARADDDGFVANPKKILRTLGGSSDDYKVLVAKKFLIEFEDGVCVIKHWRINNFIRKDIYKETKYLDLKRSLFIRSNGAYTLNDDGQAIPVPNGHYKLEDVDSTLTQRQLRIGKDREDTGASEDGQREEEELIKTEEYDIEETGTRFKKQPKYPNAKTVFAWFPFQEKSWTLNTTELKHAELLFLRGEKKVRGILDFLARNADMEFLPEVNKPSDLERKWTAIIKFAERNGL